MGGSFFVENILLHPKSRGTIRLQSTDPFDQPLIDPNYLDHPDDIKDLFKGNLFFPCYSISNFIVYNHSL